MVKKKARTSKKKTTNKVAKKTTTTPAHNKKPRKKKSRKTKKPSKKNTKDAPRPLALMWDRVQELRARRPDAPAVALRSDPVVKVPTRFQAFNAIVGGGVNKGSIIEIFGPENSGKTSWAFAVAGDIQRQAPPGRNIVVMVNYEIPFDYEWWETLGCDVTEEGPDACFVQLRPTSLEEGMGDLAFLLETGCVCACIIDSVYAARPKGAAKMLEEWRDSSKSHMAGAGGIGLQARQWGLAWTAIKDLIFEKQVICIAVNQERIVIETGGAPRRGYGKAPTTTPGGRALKFYSWVRLALEGRVLLDSDGKVRKDVDGRAIKLRFIKNKISKELPGRISYDLIRGGGFDQTKELVDLALQSGAIEGKGGGNFYIGKKRIRGRSKLIKLIEDNEPLRDALVTHTKRYLDKTVEENRDEIEKVLGVEE